MIRALAADDLPAVAGLYARRLRGGDAAPLLAEALRRYFLDCPWRDPDLPSLVATAADGRILGFLGVSVRRMTFDGQPIRYACSGPLVALPEAPGTGIQLMRRFLAGPQDLGVTDGATRRVAEMWAKLGGRTVPLTSLDWFETLTPAALAAAWSRDRLNAPWLSAATRPVWALADAVMRRRWQARPEAGVRSVTLTPQGLVEALRLVGPPNRLRPAYDQDFAAWMFAEMERLTTRGHCVRRLVRDARGRAAGWHVGFAKPGSYASLVQVAARPGMEGLVLDDALRQAAAVGAVAVRGRLEGHIAQAVMARRAWLRRGWPGLVHSRHSDILAAIVLGEALLSRLDGEWWMALHAEPYRAAAA